MLENLFPGGLWLFFGVLILLITFNRWLKKQD